jgi:hypothetical protein
MILHDGIPVFSISFACFNFQVYFMFSQQEKRKQHVPVFKAKLSIQSSLPVCSVVGVGSSGKSERLWRLLLCRVNQIEGKPLSGLLN